jgi:hypothetical protein
MALPARTIVLFHFQRQGYLLTPTGGGLRDATPEECEHAVGHGWLEEPQDGELCLNLAVQGIEMRPMEVAMEQVAEHDEQWKQMAREALAELLPECEVGEGGRWLLADVVLGT